MISQKIKFAEAIRYALSRWQCLTRFLNDCSIEIDSNVVERLTCPIATSAARNHLFAGPDAGCERAAAIYSRIETANLNGLDPHAYLRDVLARIADHPVNRVGDLLPWTYAAKEAVDNAA